MPDARFGGEIFTLGADASIDGRWGIVPYEALADASLSGHLQADLGLSCHHFGIELAALASATGNAEAASVLRLALAGQAAAGAGVSAALGFETDAFRQVRIGAELGAWAFARASGHVAVGLDAGHLAGLLADAAGGDHTLLYRLSIIVLEELDLRAGVWGGVAAAAMARARLTATLTLSDRGAAEPGLTYDVEAALGAGAGGHVHALVAGRLTNPRRMVGRLSRVATSAFRKELAEILPPEAEPALRLLELILPVATQLSFELGERALLDTLGTEDARARPVVLTIIEQLQRLTLAGVLEAADTVVSEAIYGIARAIESGVIDTALADEIRSRIPGVTSLLEELPRVLDGDLRPEDAFALVTPAFSALIELLSMSTGEATLETARRPIAVSWTSLAILATMGPAAARAAANGSFLGFGAEVGGDLREEALPPPPAIVAVDIASFVPSVSSPPTVVEGLAYLAAALPGEYLSTVPALAPLNDLMAEHLEIQPSRLLVEVLVAGMEAGAGAATYRLLEAFLDAAIREYVEPSLTNARTNLRGPRHAEARAWLDEVVHPSVTGLRLFLLQQVSRFVDGELTLENVEPFSKAAGQIAYRLAVPASVLVADQVAAAALDGLHDGLRDLSARLRSGGAAAVADAFAEIMTEAAGLPSTPAVIEATRVLAADLVDVLADVHGPAVFTPERRAALRAAVREALADPVGSTLADAAAWDQWLLRVADCEAIPAIDELRALIDAQWDLLTAWAAVAARPTGAALERFFLVVGAAAVDELERLAVEGLNRIRQAIHDFTRDAATAAIAAANALENMNVALQAVVADVAGILAHIGTNRFRDAFLAALDDLVSDPDDAAYQAVRDLIESTWFIVDGATEVLSGIIGGAADAASLVLHLAAALARFLATVFDILAVVTEEELTSAAEIALVGTGGPAALVTLDAMVHAHMTAVSAASSAEATKSAAIRSERDYLGAGRPSLAVRILDPRATSSLRRPVWYGDAIAVAVAIDGAHPSWLTSRDQRIRLALNGTSLAVSPSSWTDTGAGLSLRTTMQTGPGRAFRLGINVLEVSVVSGRGVVARGATSFFMDCTRHVRTGSVSVDMEASVLNAPGDDHARAAQEEVVLRAAHQRVDVSGWQISDRVGHTYRVPVGTVLPARARLHLHTGRRPQQDAPEDSLTDVHRWWGRRAAVWNNTGDSVLVTDREGFVVTQMEFGRSPEVTP